MGWIISPSDGVENYDDGSFLLPCSESNVTYDVTYVSPEGCSSNTISYTYVTSGSCGGPGPGPTPDCPTQSDIINTSITVANTGGTQVEVMQILKDSTYTAYTITATSTSSSYVSNINQGDELHDDWYVVLADVTANPDTTDRPLYFDVVVEGPTLGTGCTYSSVTVTQKEGCPTGFLTGFRGTIQEEGATCVPLGRFKNNLTDYTTAFTVTVSDGSTMAICQTDQPWGEDALWNLVQINVPQNPSESARTITIECTLTKGTKTCSESINITQPGSTPSACDNLGLTATTADVGSGVGNVSVGTISGSHTISAGTGTPSWITVKKGIGDPAPVSLTIQQNTSTSARTGTVTFNVDGTDCAGKTVSVSQSGNTEPQPWEKTFYYNIMMQGTGGGTVNKTLAFKIGVLMSGTFVDEGPIFAQQTTNVTGLQGSWQPSAASFKKVDTIQIEGDPTSDAKYITIKASEEGTTEPYELLPKAEIPLNGGVRAGELIFHTPYTFDKPMGTLYFYFDKT